MSPDNKDEIPRGSAADVFESVVWPAVAGNVLWSFLTVALSEEPSPAWGIRCASLLAVGAYLIASWCRTRRVPTASRPGYFFIDGFYAAMLSVFAVATAVMANSTAQWAYGLATAALVLMFLSAVIGHWTGYWAPYEKVDKGTDKEKKERLLRGLFSAAALCGLVGYYVFGFQGELFDLSSSNEELLVVRSHVVAIAAVIIALVWRRLSLSGQEAAHETETPLAPAKMHDDKTVDEAPAPAADAPKQG